MTDELCSTLSLEVGEPLAGSAAADTDRFLVLEHDQAWGPKGVEDSGLPEAVLHYLHDLGARHPRLRVQLVRRPEDATHRGVRLYLAETGESPALYALTLGSLSDLPSLELEAWLRGESPAPGARELEPLYLVCVHGKRDRCCALLGLPVYRALREQVGSRALQTTHLGGHRFAATLLSLPAGMCYGRVLAEEAPALVAATERDELHHLSRVRGRTAYASEAQAAEVMLREQLGELRQGALTLQSSERLDATTFRLRFVERDSGRTHTLDLTRDSLPAAPSSCGAAPKPVSRLIRAPSSPA